MKVEVIQDHACTKPKVIIYTHEITDEVERLVKRLSVLIEEDPILGKSMKTQNVHVLYPEEIIKVYASCQKVFVMTNDDEFQVKSTLYEIEEQLSKFKFIRISKSEIINKSKMLKLDLSIHGTICVYLEGDRKAFVSRRYVAKIKEVIGI